MLRIRNSFTKVRAQNRIIILDTCYSGMALKLSDSADGLVKVKRETIEALRQAAETDQKREAVAGSRRERAAGGAFTICSSSQGLMSDAKGAFGEHTAFTGALLRAIEYGDPENCDRKLSLKEIVETTSTLLGSDHPEPVYEDVNGFGDVPLIGNYQALRTRLDEPAILDASAGGFRTGERQIPYRQTNSRVEMMASDPSSIPDLKDEMLRVILQDLLRSDEDMQSGLYRLASLEPERDGWRHRGIRIELQKIMEDQSCPAKKRVQAGDALSRVGDPRFRPDAWYLPADELLGFVKIPAGMFLMGMDSPSHPSEGPSHRVELREFYLGRFPVTVAQFRSFLRETVPGQAQEIFAPKLDNHPVVSVTWTDAILYCKWLTNTLRDWPGTPGEIAELLRNCSWVVTLPSEAEWEKAARGMADVRLFPWGPIFDAELANCAPTRIGRPSAVGCFIGGKSPFEIEEMSGNVWEWTCSIWGTNLETPQFKYPYKRDARETLQTRNHTLLVVRGGSFSNGQDDIQCSRRIPVSQTFPGEHIGFRLALAHLEHEA